MAELSAGAIVPFDQRPMRFIPLAESEEIELTVALVANTIAVKTKKGIAPSVRDVLKFMMLCKSRRLNPFVGDAYLIGYDSNDGPVFNLISAIQSLRKRAESHPQFDGSERGVIVQRGEETIERPGTMTFEGEKLVGGWGRVYRKDYKVPFYETVKLATYSTGQSRWAKDKEGMIAKVGEAAALRRAFPSDVGALYIAEEFDAEAAKPGKIAAGNAKVITLDELAKGQGPARTEPVGGATEPEGETAEEQPQGDAEPENVDPKSRQKLAEHTLRLAKAMKITEVAAEMELAQNSGLLSLPDLETLQGLAADQIALIQDAEEADRAG